MSFFPAVGLVIGGLLALGAIGFGRIWPPGVTAALVLAEWVILTGALHLDGWLDCCDGLLAPKPPADRLQILRDVHAGSFAVAGGVVLLIAKYAALVAVLGAGSAGILALCVAPIVSRWAMVYATVMYPYARPAGSLGGLFALTVVRRSLIAATACAVVAAVLLAGWMGLLTTALAWAVTAGFARWAMSRIPGMTGDVYGATNEMVELAALLLAGALFQAGVA